MKKIILFFVFTCLCGASFAQTLQERLYYTGKVWGFVKYNHSEVSTCKVNWDSVLLHVLPLVENATTSADFNDALDTMLAAAGPMALSTSYLAPITDPMLTHNRDLSWIGTSGFRSDVQAQLDTIKNNFRPHASCYVTINTDYTRSFSGPWGGYLAFPYDSTMLLTTTYSSYPDEDHRLLLLYKFWNTVRYFNPYNYVLDKPWDTTLYNYVLPVSSAPDAHELFKLCLKMATEMNDAHVLGFTASKYYFTPPGSYVYIPKILLVYAEGKYVVLRSKETGINTGDVLVSVDGLNPAQWEDSLRPYKPSGNISVFRRSMCDYILSREAAGKSETVIFADNTGTNHTFTITTGNRNTDPTFFSGSHYVSDSLKTIKWTTMGCDAGYVNMGNLLSTDVVSMYNDLLYKSAIIFDIRNYPNGTGWGIANLMYPSNRKFAKFTMPDLTYPGTYYWEGDSLGTDGNATPYAGKVIVLVNEQTQSQAEFTTMMLKAMPDVVVVGSQTAGADGDVTWVRLANDISFGWTSLGVFYPNGDSTQRIGIVPDITVTPTVNGIRNFNDEVLNKALSLACPSEVVNVDVAPVVAVFPNPANDKINVLTERTGAGKIVMLLTDITGRTLLHDTIESNGSKTATVFNIATLSPGMYFVTVQTATKQYVTKIVKE
ncbi:MAG: peptidase [Flavipsychrobacter sp.]|nr:peptidase [Flavipsychrobacter sp.]